MVDIQSVAAVIRQGKKEEEDRRKKLQGKNIMAPLLHRAAIISTCAHHIFKNDNQILLIENENNTKI